MYRSRKPTNELQQLSPLPGPEVPGHHIQCYPEQHVWVIDQVLLPCTPAQYACLELLLQHVNMCVPFATFWQNEDLFPVQMEGTDERTYQRPRLSYIISTMRAKLWPLGFDVVNAWNTGYILLNKS